MGSSRQLKPLQKEEAFLSLAEGMIGRMLHHTVKMKNSSKEYFSEINSLVLMVSDDHEIRLTLLIDYPRIDGYVPHDEVLAASITDLVSLCLTDGSWSCRLCTSLLGGITIALQPIEDQ